MKRQKGKHRAPKVAGRSAGWFVSLLTLVLGVSVVVFPSAAKWATAIELAKDGQEYTLTANAQSARRFTEAVGVNEAGDYKGALTAITVEGTNAIARLQIPSIGVDLPVYPDSTDETLKKGAGHLEGSALPVGGLGTRSVITAHSGMPNKRMFDRLPKLDNGDLVYVTVLGQTLTYEVTGQRVDTPPGRYETHPTPSGQGPAHPRYLHPLRSEHPPLDHHRAASPRLPHGRCSCGGGSRIPVVGNRLRGWHWDYRGSRCRGQETVSTTTQPTKKRRTEMEAKRTKLRRRNHLGANALVGVTTTLVHAGGAEEDRRP